MKSIPVTDRHHGQVMMIIIIRRTVSRIFQTTFPASVAIGMVVLALKIMKCTSLPFSKQEDTR